MRLEFVGRLNRVVLTEGTNLHKFLEMFTCKEKLNFWVAVSESNSFTPQIVGCVGMVYHDLKTMPRKDGMYERMKKYGLDRSIEIKVRPVLFFVELRVLILLVQSYKV